MHEIDFFMIIAFWRLSRSSVNEYTVCFDHNAFCNNFMSLREV